jgi:hypothetical protein
MGVSRADNTITLLAPGQAPSAFALTDDSVTELATGPARERVLGLRTDGSACGWTSSGNPLMSPFLDSLSGVREIVDTSGAIFALMENGSLRAEGALRSNSYGSRTIPVNPLPVFPTFKDIMTQWGALIALTESGEIVTWGWLPEEVKTLLATEKSVRRLVKEGGSALAQRHDGSLIYLPTAGDLAAAAPSGGELVDAVEFAGTGKMTVALMADGRVVGWGAGAQDLARLIDGRPVSRILFKNEKPIVFTAEGELLGAGLPAAVELVTSPVLDAVLGYNDGLLILHDLKTGVIRGQSAGVQALLSGQAAGVWADVTGSHLSFQWFLGDEIVEGAVSPGLSLGLSEAATTGSYRLRVRNPAGDVWSEPIVVRKLDGQAPQRRVVLTPGHPLELTGTIPDAVSYRWLFNGREIDGEAAANLTWPEVGTEDTGAYTLEATLSDGVVTRATSFVRIVPEHRALATWTYIEGYDLVRREKSIRTDAVDFYLGQNIIGGAALFLVRPDGGVIEPSLSAAPGLTDAVALIPAGWWGVLALGADGSVSAPTGQIGAPAGLSRVVELAGDSQEYFALLDDGSVLAWGPSRIGLDLLTSAGERVLQLTSAFGVLADGRVKLWTPATSAAELALSGSTDVRRVVSIAGGYVVEHGDGSVVRIGTAETLPAFDVMPRGIHDFAGDPVFEAIDDSLSGPGNWLSDGLSSVVKVATRPRQITVMQEIGAPTVETPLTKVAALTEQRLVLSAEVEGDFLSYRWEKDGKPVPSANRSHLILDSVGSGSAGQYVLIATNESGEARSEAITVRVFVGTPPPRRSVVDEGNPLTLRVQAPDATSVRWLKNGRPIDGATNTTLAFSQTRATDAGAYVAEVVMEGETLRFPSFLAIDNPTWELARFGVYGSYDGKVVTTDVPSGSVVSLNALPITREGGVLSFGMGGPAFGGIVHIDNLWGNAVTKDGEVRWSSPFHSTRTMPVAALSEVIAVARGFALKADGTRVQLDPENLEPADPTMADFFPEVRPQGLSAAPILAVPIEAYGTNFVQLRDDGTLELSWEAPHGWEDFGNVRNVVSLASGYILYRSQAPKILRHPLSQTAYSSGAVLSVEVSEHPVTYQWYRNGRAIAAPAGTEASYWVAPNPDVAGNYHVKVTNRRGSATSRTARVVIGLPNPFPATLVTRFGYFSEFATYLHGATDEGPRLFVRGLPPGLSFDARTGAITGTIEKTGTYKITYGYEGGASGSSWSETVQFVVSAWAHGPFEALLRRGDFEFGEVFGKVTMQVGLDGKFTGSVTRVDRGTALPFQGRLTGLGNEVEILLADRSLLRVRSDHEGTGAVYLETGDDSSGGPLRAVKKYAGNAVEHAPWSASRTVRFTAGLIDPRSRAESDERPLPPGSGRFELIAEANGELQLRGRLADGKTVTASLRPDADGEFRWLSKPYGNGAHVGGAFQMRQNSTGRFGVEEESISWTKGAGSGRRVSVYPGGFAAVCRLVAAPWDQPETTQTADNFAGLLGLSSSDEIRVEVLFDNPEAAFELPLMSFDARAGQLNPLSPEESASNLVLRIDRSTGRLSGAIPFRFRAGSSADRRKWSVEGVAFQASGHAADALADGYLLPPSGVGSQEERAGRIHIIVNDAGK